MGQVEKMTVCLVTRKGVPTCISRIVGLVLQLRYVDKVTALTVVDL